MIEFLDYQWYEQDSIRQEIMSIGTGESGLDEATIAKQIQLERAFEASYIKTCRQVVAEISAWLDNDAELTDEIVEQMVINLVILILHMDMAETFHSDSEEQIFTRIELLDGTAWELDRKIPRGFFHLSQSSAKPYVAA